MVAANYGGAVYELFLLGKLLARPWYGYEFQQALNGFFGPQRRVSWGTIYPLFQRLKREGLIRATNGRGLKDRRDKQAYTITAAGRKHFLELMRVEGEHDPHFRELFRIKLGHFSRVDHAIREQIILAYMKRLSAIQRHTTEMSSVIEGSPGMSEEERTMILLAIRHERSLAEAEMDWMREHFSDLLDSTQAMADVHTR